MFVSDVAWYCPAGYLYINWGQNPHQMLVPVPSGFTYDFVSDTTLAEMRVADARRASAGGGRVTNLWPNRLIGDDFKPEDCTFEPGQPLMARHLNGWPAFIREGKPSPSGKQTFATWKHWTKDDAPLPSGLLGPVSVLSVRTAGK